MRAARLGGPIALIVIGLVLALAIRDSISGVDLVMIGWIAAGAGALWLLLELVMNRPRSRRTREVYRDDV
ncbi:DUF6458 family protein [Enemella evansiae]|uniref:DUF6458 family protein n=1 Tax=Enemella evansiae TaxID=2016499 RepID=UPI000B971E29|nr:DUF6458 family protein [Enemella evansiae]OYN94017.1 hypothetical protein CGZ96_19290 [Enemella evansiae]OYN95304.1 hypothetical protein CGZ95_16315 [Enemella evansiae]OYO03407.1 hypothetical protein CGZ97_08080 [Enemella evansiae]PFG68698.1 hypothetical protein B0O41_3541 [Propionibacteriaceae bacterium ES.041]